MRQIVLDTETTGLEPSQGHRIIEIGCVEIIDRKLTGNHYHVYIQPDREVDVEAFEVHGISNEFLAGKPRFAEIADEFLNFIKGAELVIHNAAFDVGFIDHEFAMLGKQYGRTQDHCGVVDTLLMARKKHPGQKNNLDALCRRYGIDNSHRDLHGALLDSEILADVYLMMTGGQTALMLHGGDGDGDESATEIKRLSADRPRLRVVKASEEEMSAHNEKLDSIEKSSGACLWKQLDG
ncbi:DNA polymerase III subunit epsilon [Hahella sp. CCB-MM4]|uniref:DNA polymerase III subunit epsilon n=1 Tax=Hahella sp. (strain CCB-MM4) TaxID=1926491 RepID=UPI000B9BF25F|nr:DNA polymerase III subunit epsilon [Hahella sp. CCB-MM4]OZG73637.1 DNA polymerase III subunit epsilon [Hahella sp. CCB-MM4]